MLGIGRQAAAQGPLVVQLVLAAIGRVLSSLSKTATKPSGGLSWLMASVAQWAQAGYLSRRSTPGAFPSPCLTVRRTLGISCEAPKLTTLSSASSVVRRRRFQQACCCHSLRLPYRQTRGPPVCVRLGLPVHAALLRYRHTRLGRHSRGAGADAALGGGRHDRQRVGGLLRVRTAESRLADCCPGRESAAPLKHPLLRNGKPRRNCAAGAC